VSIIIAKFVQSKFHSACFLACRERLTNVIYCEPSLESRPNSCLLQVFVLRSNLTLSIMSEDEGDPINERKAMERAESEIFRMFKASVVSIHLKTFTDAKGKHILRQNF